MTHRGDSQGLRGVGEASESKLESQREAPRAREQYSDSRRSRCLLGTQGLRRVRRTPEHRPHERWRRPRGQKIRTQAAPGAEA